MKLHFAHAHANCTRLLDRRVEPGDEARDEATRILTLRLHYITLYITLHTLDQTQLLIGALRMRSVGERVF